MTNKATMRIKNWAKFQHFKDRRPPWIKLYRDILDDVDWHELSGDDAKTLVMLWVIASENDGELPNSKTLAFRLHSTVKQIESSIAKLTHWIETERYQDDINLSQNNSLAEVSNHQETETEGEKETDTSPAKLPTCPVDEIVDLYQTILPELPSVRLMDKDRVKGIKDRWQWVLTSNRSDGTRRASTRDDAKKWFESYFERTRDNDFLMGRKEGAPGHKNWKCDIDFLMTTKGVKHVIEKTEATA